jgi:hypothetical protein
MKPKKEECSEDAKSTHCCNHKSKFRFTFIAILLVLCCAVAEYFFSKYNCAKLLNCSKIETMTALGESQKSYEEQLKKVSDEVATLKAEFVKLKCELDGKYEYGKSPKNSNDTRKKWKAWSELKAKVEANRQFSKELHKFRSEFSYDRELVELVDDCVKNICVIGDGDGIIDICKRYICCVFGFCKADHKKLLEISGYVLSSVDNEGGK